VTHPGRISTGDLVISAGRSVVLHEGRAVAQLTERLGDEFGAAGEIILAARGRVACIGLGKSGIIARKFTATLASLGTPALFIHATEALHGDLGMITRDDVVIVLSHSGSTPEILAILSPLAELSVPIIAITDHADSPLARAADCVLCPNVMEEADHLGLAPTTSTTAALVLTDALAVAVARVRGFTRADFLRTHPGGLGRKFRSSEVDV